MGSRDQVVGESCSIGKGSEQSWEVVESPDRSGTSGDMVMTVLNMFKTVVAGLRVVLVVLQLYCRSIVIVRAVVCDRVCVIVASHGLL